MNLGDILNKSGNDAFLDTLKTNLEKVIAQHEQQKQQNKINADEKDRQNDNALKANIETLRQSVENQQKIQRNNALLNAAAKGKINASNPASGTVQARI